MTDAQWQTLVGAIGVPGAVFLYLWLRKRARPEGRSDRVEQDHYEKLVEKLNDLSTQLTEVAQMNRHDARNTLTVMQGELLNAIHDLEILVRDLQRPRR